MSFLKKGFIVVIIAHMFFFSASQKTYAYAGIADIVIDPTNLAQNTISAIGTTKGLLKDFLLDGIAWNVANSMIQKITAQTVNWINSGFKGNPAFVTDPGKFFLNLGDEGASRFLSGTNFNNLCAPFKNQVRLSLVKNYLSETTEQNFSCTISKVIKNYNDFTKDFTQGGWDGWFAVTQNNTNNPYGAYLTAKSELGTQNNNTIAKYSKQLDQGRGFLSYEKCTDEVNPNLSAYEQCMADYGEYAGPGACGASAEEYASNQKYANDASNSAGGDEYKNCESLYEVGSPVCDAIGDINKSTYVETTQIKPKSCKTVTPGSVIGDQLGKILGKGVDRLVVVNSINQIVGALMTQMINRVVGGGGGGGGLLGASKSSGAGTGTRSLTDQLNPSSSESRTANTTYIQNISENAPAELKSPLPTPTGSPIIILKGTNPMSAVDVRVFSDPGAYAFDPIDGDISNRVFASKDEGNGEQFHVIYSVKNSRGLSANPVTRTITSLYPPATCGDASTIYTYGTYEFPYSAQFCSVGFPVKNYSLASGTPDISVYKPTFPHNRGDSSGWKCITQQEVDNAENIGRVIVESPMCAAQIATSSVFR